MARLFKELPCHVPDDLVHSATVLHKFYIPTSYANGHSAGTSFEHCGPLQSKEAIRCAREIVALVRSHRV